MSLRHHELAIDALSARAESRGAIGLIVVGSVARGTARASSDVDAYEVVSDEIFVRALARGDISWVETEGCDWEGGYCDLKLASPAMLRAAAERGDDPMRASLVGSRVVFDKRGDLASLVASVVDSPPSRFAELVRSFSAQLALYGGYFLPQALAHDNSMLARSAAVHAATAAGRLVLAHHAVHYRGAKYMVEQLEALPSSPTGIVSAIVRLSEQPSMEALHTVRDLLGELPHAESDTIDDHVLSRFIVDNEMSWYTGVPPAEAR